MADHDAAAMERHFYEQSLLDPHCTYPGCQEASDPDTHSHCECGTMVSRDEHGRCLDCVAVDAGVKVSWSFRYRINGRKSSNTSRRDVPVGLGDALRELEQFAASLRRAVSDAQRSALAFVDRPSRVEQVNRLLELISTHERGFFGFAGRVAVFSLGTDSRLRYTDERYRRPFLIEQDVRQAPSFSHGGGLWRFVLALRDYIQRGDRLDSEFGEHWGYNATRLAEIRTAARDLGIAEETSDEAPF